MSRQPNFEHIVIKASAGTGKTYQLAVRFIGLLAAGASPDEILATTFTRKAAGEILDRVLSWLAAAADDDAERENLATAIGISLTKEKCRDLLRATASRLHALRVGTLDSYFLRVATNFGHELGLPPGWTICDEMVDSVLREDAIEQVLSARAGDLLTLVHALTKGTTARSVARLMTDTVNGLLELYRETDANAWQQIKAGRGLEPAELDEVLQAIEGLTFGDKRMISARTDDLARFRAEAWDDFLGKGLAGKVAGGESKFYNKPLSDDVVGLYGRWLRHVESIVVGQVARQTEATHDLLERFSERYQSLQLAERALRFSDVTYHLADAAADLSPERLAFRLDGNIRHVLLDEFQDTSPVQWRILRPLAEAVSRRSGGSFFCVGDVKQAIYGWRGGVAAIFDALQQQLTGLSTKDLSKSYRSSPAVIHVVNEVFQNLTRHPHLDKLAAPVRAWQTVFPEHTTAKEKLLGHVMLRTSPLVGDDQRQADASLRYAAERVRDLCEQAPTATVGVLVRTNAAIARVIFELRRLGIFASEEGGNPLLDSPAVEIVLSLLKLADHPADSVARFHLATSPLAEPLGLSNFRSDVLVAQLSQRVRRELLEVGYGRAIFGWAKLLAAGCDQRDLTRLQQLVELAYEYQASSTLRTSDFLRLVEKRRIADPQAAAVRVMTIHQAKGLEFDIVVLPELDVRLIGQPDRVVAGRPSPSERVDVVCRLANENVRQFFPPRVQKLFQDDMCLEVTESLCLLYVAMTRAARTLEMIIPPSKPSEKHVPKTFAGLLRATLAPDKPAAADQILYEHGDRQWHLALRKGDAAGSSIASPANAAAPVQIKLADSQGQRQRGLERTSPSGLEGGRKLPATAIIKSRNEFGLAVGTLMHAWLAEIEWLDDGMPNDAMLKRVLSKLQGRHWYHLPKPEQLKSRFQEYLKAEPIQRLLQRTYYSRPESLGLAGKVAWPNQGIELQALRERQFAMRSGNQMLAGSIDRLVLIRQQSKPIAADIIDFKTDDISAGQDKELQERVAFYQPQVEAYRAAVSTVFGLSPDCVCGRLAFLVPGQVVQVAPAVAS